MFELRMQALPAEYTYILFFCSCMKTLNENNWEKKANLLQFWETLQSTVLHALETQ